MFPYEVPGSDAEFYAPYDAYYARVYEEEPIYNEDVDADLEALLAELETEYYAD